MSCTAEALRFAVDAGLPTVRLDVDSRVRDLSQLTPTWEQAAPQRASSSSSPLNQEAIEFFEPQAVISVLAQWLCYMSIGIDRTTSERKRKRPSPQQAAFYEEWFTQLLSHRNHLLRPEQWRSPSGPRPMSVDVRRRAAEAQLRCNSPTPAACSLCKHTGLLERQLRAMDQASCPRCSA